MSYFSPIPVHHFIHIFVIVTIIQISCHAERYLGDQRFSYNQFLTFDLQIGEETARPSVVDIIFEGSGQRIATHIFAQGNPVPDVTSQSYAFRLHEDPQFQWSPRLKPQEFISILANVTALKIRATYNPDGRLLERERERERE